MRVWRGGRRRGACESADWCTPICGATSFCSRFRAAISAVSCRRSIGAFSTPWSSSPVSAPAALPPPAADASARAIGGGRGFGGAEAWRSKEVATPASILARMIADCGRPPNQIENADCVTPTAAATSF